MNLARGGPPSLFRLEVKAALAGVRAIGLRVGVTLLLGLPFVLVAVPLRIGAAGMAMLVTFTALFGAVVGGVRRREDGRREHLRLLPLPRWLVAADTILAGATVDMVQIAPLMVAFAASRAAPASWATVVGLAGALAASLLLLNALGLAVASRVRTNAEAHLYGALAVAGAALFSGLVPTPEHLQGLVAVTARWSPLHHLAAMLQAVAGEDPGVTIWPMGATLVVFLVTCAARARCPAR